MLHFSKFAPKFLIRSQKVQSFTCKRINQQRCRQASSQSSSSSLLQPPRNEPILDYNEQQNCNQRNKLEKELARLASNVTEIPIVIGGETFVDGQAHFQRIPFEHSRELAKFYYATPTLINKAIDNALVARQEWTRSAIEKRLEVFEAAASLVSGKYRQTLNAATMLGQAKTVIQAEIDAAGELADFLRFNVYYCRQLLTMQPNSTQHAQNSIVFRCLDGFVAAISPFNFTAIGGNLAAAPALFGNAVVWKPSDASILANYVTFEILREAGLPSGLLNFVPANGLDFGQTIARHSKLAGINFTGSVATFRWLWRQVGANIDLYESFPRLVGETGGKNYHFVHPSASIETVISQTIKSAFEYSGQKCSACSRLFVPQSMWPRLKPLLVETTEALSVGPATDLSVFTSAVIDKKAFERVTGFIKLGKANNEPTKLICGGQFDSSIGYFVRPTIFETSDPIHSKLMRDEIFGPILIVYVYDEAKLDDAIEVVKSSPYALTGAIFAQDKTFLANAQEKLRMTAGNLYINDKCTGAVVGQQPFGGSKLSGTNDKAGGPHYLMRWCNQQTVKRALC